MKIVAHPTNNPTPRREWDWRAYDADTYDMTGIDEDGSVYSDHPVGEGATKEAAIADLMAQIEDRKPRPGDKAAHGRKMARAAE